MNRDISRKLKTLCVLAAAPLVFSFIHTAHSDALQAQPSDKEAFFILKQKCLQCHGETVRMSGLDLRTLETILKGGEKGPAIVPGNAEASLLYQRVAGLEKPAMPMAPLPPLTQQEIAVLKSWIDRVSRPTARQGVAAKSAPSVAGYKERAITTEDRQWWSFQKPAPYPIPKVTDPRWKANPIDAFIKYLHAGGQPFFPAIPKSVRESYLQGKWVMTTEEPSTWRRSVYAYWKRGLKYPMFEVHDQPDPNVTCEMRNTTTVPTQALTLLNNEFVLIQARHFAERVVREAGADPAKQIRVLYQIALAREPSQKEMNQSLTFLRNQRDYHAGKASGADSGLSALTDLAHVTLNASEFVYIN